MSPVIVPRRALLLLRTALCVLCLTCLSGAVLASVASAASAVVEEGGVKYQHEAESAFEQQLSSGQIQAATIHPSARTVHLTLSNGQHVFINFPAHQEARVRAQLEAKSVAITVTTAKHKLRYIAGGIVIVVIILVVVVLLLRRRRQRAEE